MTARFVAYCRWLLDQGADGLAVFGTTSEATSLSLAERQHLLERLIAAGIAPAKAAARHRPAGAAGNGGAHPSCRGPRLRRRADAAAVLLQESLGRRAGGRLCRDDRAGRAIRACGSTSITYPRCRACRSGSRRHRAAAAPISAIRSLASRTVRAIGRTPRPCCRHFRRLTIFPATESRLLGRHGAGCGRLHQRQREYEHRHDPRPDRRDSGARIKSAGAKQQTGRGHAPGDGEGAGDCRHEGPVTPRRPVRPVGPPSVRR